MGPWQRSRAFNVVRATARMTVLAKKMQLAGQDAAGAEAPLLDCALEAGPSPYPDLHDVHVTTGLSRPGNGLANLSYLSPPASNGTVSRTNTGNWTGLCEPLPQVKSTVLRHFSRVSGESTCLPRNDGITARHPHGMGMQHRWYVSDLYAVHQLLKASWFSMLLLCVPLGFASELLHWGAVPTFTLNFCSLIPLALILGDITEDLALRFGDVAGGLINATFGNVTEVILSLSALNKGLYIVVATSLMGSILSNLLLVLGCCMFFGGLRYKIQTFNQIGNRACSSLLFLSTLGVVIPTAAEHLVADDDRGPNWVLDVSRGTAIILFLCYGCYLYFQLGTHRELFQASEENGEEEVEEPMLSLVSSLGLLTGITVLVAFASEFLTGSIQEVSEQTGLGEAFLGMIVLPVAGNACEHITAVIVARKNKMDLALGVAIGSSIQIATFAIPLAVLYGWAAGHDFSLSLDPFSALALMLSVVHANFVGADATSHWLMGVQLLAVYFLIALTYFYR